jgi:hypothetical protein
MLILNLKARAKLKIERRRLKKGRKGKEINK